MVQFTRQGLDALKPPSEKLHADALADRIASLITPLHPVKSDVRLRLGQSKRGQMLLYKPDGREWRLFGPPPNAVLTELAGYTQLLVYRTGTGGIRLLYFEPELVR